MTNNELKELQRGDIIRHENDLQTFVVMSNYGGRVTAAATVDVTNPCEWDIVLKADYKKPVKYEKSK